MNEYSFEKLEVYQLAREYRRKIYKLTYKLPEKEQYNLIIQMRKAALSVTNNMISLSAKYPIPQTIQRFLTRVNR